MSSIHADPRLRNKRHYIAAEAFNSVFYSYTTSMNPTTYVTTGSLGSVAGASAANCPQGRILRENGKRLYPDAHPGITTMMVGVYDANSGLNGFIDPNAPQFAVFNSDKPIEIVDGGDNNTTVPHKGQPVYTTGDVIANGDAIIGGYIASAYVSPTVVQDTNNNNTYIDAREGNNFVAALTYTAAAAGYTYLYFGNDTVTAITPADGEVISVAIRNATGQTQTVVINQTYKSVEGYTNNPGVPIVTIPNGTVRTLSFISDGTYLYLNNAGNITSSTGSTSLNDGATARAGGFARLTVTAPACRTTSRVFFTYSGLNNPGILSAENIANGSFQIVSNSQTDLSVVQWMIINP